MAFAHLFSQRLLAAGASATTCSGGSMRASSDVQVARGGDVDEAKLRRGCIQKRSGIVKPSTNFKHWNDNVSRMYPECIPMYPEGCVEPMYPDVSRGSRSSERCIPSNVSRMYPECIPNVSRMYPENPGKVFFFSQLTANLLSGDRSEQTTDMPRLLDGASTTSSMRRGNPHAAKKTYRPSKQLITVLS